MSMISKTTWCNLFCYQLLMGRIIFNFWQSFLNVEMLLIKKAFVHQLKIYYYSVSTYS